MYKLKKIITFENVSTIISVDIGPPIIIVQVRNKSIYLYYKYIIYNYKVRNKSIFHFASKNNCEFYSDPIIMHYNFTLSTWIHCMLI